MKIYVKADITPIHEEDNEFRWKLACSRNTRPQILKQLLYDPDRWVRHCAALNPNVPVAWLEDVAEDSACQEAICLREDVPDDFLRNYADQYYEYAYGMLKRGAATSDEIRRYYNTYNSTRGNGWHENLFEWMASDPATPPDILAQLIQEVSHTQHVIYNPATPTDLLVHLLRETPGNSGYRDMIHNKIFNALDARGELIPVFEQLSTDPDWHCRRIVAGNYKTPNDILRHLIQDVSVRVRNAAAKTLEVKERNGWE